MPDSNLVLLKIDVRDPKREQEEVEEFTQYLVSEFKEIEGVEYVDLVPETKIPEHSKSVGGFVTGLLTSKITFEGVKTVFSVLKDMVANKPIELEINANGKSLKVKASNLQELEKGIELAQKFISG